MIAEIWRKPAGPGMPIRFSIGDAPQFINDEGVMEDVPESPPVKSINYYVTGAFQKAANGPAFTGPCYVVQFEDSPIRRVIPKTDVKDIAWLSPQKDVVAAVPPLED